MANRGLARSKDERTIGLETYGRLASFRASAASITSDSSFHSVARLVLARGVAQHPFSLLQLAGLAFELGSLQLARPAQGVELLGGRAEVARHRLDEETVERLLGVQRGYDALLILQHDQLLPSQPREPPLRRAALMLLDLHDARQRLQPFLHPAIPSPARTRSRR